MNIIEAPSPNFSDRRKKIDMIVIHSTAGSAVGALSWMQKVKSRVSSHYLIDKKGQIYRLVNDDKTAWHAGHCNFHGEKNLNGNSIGIELENLNDGEDPYPSSQTSSLIELVRRLMEKYSIHPFRIVRHSDIAKGRKTDPIGFDWEIFKKHLTKKEDEGEVTQKVVVEYSFWKKILNYFLRRTNGSE